jgi:hypothetical protein
MVEVGESYLHYKGNVYRVEEIVRDRTTLKEVVIFSDKDAFDGKRFCETVGRLEGFVEDTMGFVVRYRRVGDESKS